MASTSKILVACKIRQHASLDRLRKFLESQKLIKCSHKARVPAHKASVPRAQSLGLPGTKLGLGRRTKRVPSGAAPGWLHCAPSADQEQAILWAGGCPGVYCGYLWDLGTLRLKDDCVPTWKHCCLPPSGPIQHCPLNAPQWIVLNFQMVPWKN